MNKRILTIIQSYSDEIDDLNKDYIADKISLDARIAKAKELSETYVLGITNYIRRLFADLITESICSDVFQDRQAEKRRFLTEIEVKFGKIITEQSSEPIEEVQTGR